MRWIPSRILQWIIRLVRFVAESATFVAGAALTAIVHLFFEHGSAAFSTDLLLDIRVWGFILALLIFLGFYIFNRYWLEPATRNADFMTAMLQYLYHELFQNRPGYRVTFLAPLVNEGKYLYPRYRYAHGFGTHLNSKARFTRGTAVAGMAWDTPGEPIVKKIPDFKSNMEELCEFSQRELNIPERDFLLLSEDTHRARWFLSYGIAHPFRGAFIGVISIDSRHDYEPELVDVDLLNNVGAIIAYFTFSSRK